jgi:hypothetical protein
MRTASYNSHNNNCFYLNKTHCEGRDLCNCIIKFQWSMVRIITTLPTKNFMANYSVYEVGTEELKKKKGSYNFFLNSCGRCLCEKIPKKI